MLRTGVIGLGNCGGQIAAKAAKDLNVDALILNTSDQDLEKIQETEKIHTYGLGDRSGAGQNREQAKDALDTSIQDVFEDDYVKTFLDTMEVIFVICSTGGGTGSGLGPAMSEIIDDNSDAKVILIGIFPTLEEGEGIQKNSLNFLDELYNYIEEPTYMLYDNNKKSGESSITMMELVNQNVVDDIRILSGFFNHSTQYNSIDDKDLGRLISPTGRIVVAKVMDIKEKDLDTQSIEDMIIHDLKTNAHCESDRDGICQNTGIISNLSSRLNEKLNMNIPEVHKFVGKPKETAFIHISINSDEGMPNNVFFIASGLSAVNDRIRKINDVVTEIQNNKKDLAGATALDETLLADQEISAPKKRVDSPDVGSVLGRFKKGARKAKPSSRYARQIPQAPQNLSEAAQPAAGMKEVK